MYKWQSLLHCKAAHVKDAIDIYSWNQSNLQTPIYVHTCLLPKQQKIVTRVKNDDLERYKVAKEKQNIVEYASANDCCWGVTISFINMHADVMKNGTIPS